MNTTANNATALVAAMTRLFHFSYLCRRASERHRYAATPQRIRCWTAYDYFHAGAKPARLDTPGRNGGVGPRTRRLVQGGRLSLHELGDIATRLHTPYRAHKWNRAATLLLRHARSYPPAPAPCIRGGSCLAATPREDNRLQRASWGRAALRDSSSTHRFDVLLLRLRFLARV